MSASIERYDQLKVSNDYSASCMRKLCPYRELWANTLTHSAEIAKSYASQTPQEIEQYDADFHDKLCFGTIFGLML